MSHIYEDGTYLATNPNWHAEDSAWKASNIINLLEKNSLNPRSICEVGCGAGEILNQLAEHSCEGRTFFGYEISPQAFELSRRRTRANLTFTHADLLEDDTTYFDVVMAIDVFEHVEDYIGFLRKLKDRGEHKIFHIPLDLSVQTVLRSSPIIRTRRLAGHLHYFTKEIALEALTDAGYVMVISVVPQLTLYPLWERPPGRDAGGHNAQTCPPRHYTAPVWGTRWPSGRRVVAARAPLPRPAEVWH